MVLTLQIREVLAVSPRARIVRIPLGGREFPYRAGQAVMIATHNHETRRPYSIAVAPEDVKREGTLELLVGVDALGSPGPHLTLEPGTWVDVDGPVGNFVIPDSAEEQRFVFVAGGTGIAPLRAMLRQALEAPERRIGVVYSARTPEDFAYELELRQLAREGRIELCQTVTGDVPADCWTGPRGRIGPSHLAQMVTGPSTLYFICGPLPLVGEMQKLLNDLGMPQHHIRTEEWARVHVV